MKGLQWASKGDYTNPHDAGLFINLADPAMLNRNNELIANEAGQGIEGLGVADPNYLATVKENTKAHMAEDAAGKYENDIRAGVNAATGVAEDMSNLSDEDRRAILAAQTSTFNTFQSRPRNPGWLQYVLQGASAAAPFV